MSIRILFICTGNITRSQMAEGLARELTEESSEGSGTTEIARVIDTVPIDFVSGEVVERKGAPAQKFRGQLIYLTNDDVTVRRPSDAILVIEQL